MPTVEEEILEHANLTLELANNLRLVEKVLDGAARLWEMSRPCPGNDKMKVLAIFLATDDDDLPGDVRVYAMPLTSDLPFVCNTINRVHPGFVSENINERGTLIEYVAGEVSELAVAQGLLETCPDETCEGVNRPDAKVCIECGMSLEEPEEEPTVVAPAGPVGNVMAGQADHSGRSTV